MNNMMVGISDQPIVVLVLLLAWATSLATANENKYCPFDETVDLAKCTLLNNGTYTYKGRLVVPESISEYNKVMQDGSWVKVNEHKRGCVTPNVQLCCSNPKWTLDTTCPNNTMNYPYPSKVNITVKDVTGNLTVQSDLNGFFPKYGLPCNYTYKEEGESNWSLNQNGVVHVESIDQFYELGDYCLHPNNTLDKYVFELYVCARKIEPSASQNVISIIMAISAAFMILTILINFFMVKKTNHQILFLLYLICLTVSYILVIAVQHDYIDNSICTANGYIGYFTTMSTFSLLTVICVYMWNNFRGSNFYARQLNSGKQLVMGLMVSFGTASFLTLVVFLADNSSISEEFRPNIGVYACWIFTEKKNVIPIIYYYGPMSVLIIINLVMFILTTARILNLKKGVTRVNNSKNCQLQKKHLRFRKEFGLYMRILFTMGITWIFEIVDFFTDNENFSNINNFINASQGIIIFVMFGNVRLLYKRLIQAKDSDTESSSTQISAIRQANTFSAASTKKLLHEERV